MILPVYFMASPKLQKSDERDKDPVAKEIAKRQMFDWRDNANIPLQEPGSAHRAAQAMAQGVAAALEQRRRYRQPRTRRAGRLQGGAEPAGRRPDRRGRRPARWESLSARMVLWVDDRPDNNAPSAPRSNPTASGSSWRARVRRGPV